MGRTARGVRGIKLPGNTEVISLIIPNPDGMILLASQNGYGKLTEVSEFSTIGRGGQGVIAIKISERNGALVGASQVESVDECCLLVTRGRWFARAFKKCRCRAAIPRALGSSM